MIGRRGFFGSLIGVLLARFRPAQWNGNIPEDVFQDRGAEWWGEEPYETIATVLTRRTLNWIPPANQPASKEVLRRRRSSQDLANIRRWSKEDLIRMFARWSTAQQEMTGPDRCDPVHRAERTIEEYYSHDSMHYYFVNDKYRAKELRRRL